MKKIKIIYCGYRSWSLKILKQVKDHPKIDLVAIVNDQKTLNNELIKNNNIDIILFVGWSWIIKKEITDNYLCLGIHPSDLPSYRGGSPIQNQIIDGITKTKLTLFELTKDIDAGNIWAKEDLSLMGDSVSEIFDNIVNSGIKLLNRFFEMYPNISPLAQNGDMIYHSRRKPEDSKLEREDFLNKSILDIYNKIRCLTDPYPNAFIEDDEGNKLLFSGIRYIKAKDKK